MRTGAFIAFPQRSGPGQEGIARDAILPISPVPRMRTLQAVHKRRFITPRGMIATAIGSSNRRVSTGTPYFRRGKVACWQRRRTISGVHRRPLLFSLRETRRRLLAKTRRREILLRGDSAHGPREREDAAGLSRARYGVHT